MEIAVVIGNPRSGGRTTTVAEAVASHVAEGIAGTHGVTTYELSELTGALFDWSSERVAAVNGAVRTADLAIFASPVYKASFTGLLKAFLDRYPSDGLAGLVAVPVMLGAGRMHQLAVETQLRPVLVELAAVLPTKGLFVVDSELDTLDTAIEDWWQTAGGPLGRLLSPVAQVIDETA
jgi:FMN reductase